MPMLNSYSKATHNQAVTKQTSLIRSVWAKVSVKWLVFTLCVFAGLIKLGLWQNDRALEKEQRLAQMALLNSQQAVSLTQVSMLQQAQQNINDYPIFVEGTFNPNYVFLLDNQVNKGSLGYKVLQIVENKNRQGSDKGQAVLVNLGWVQGSINRQEIPQITPLTGLHRFHGKVRIIEKGIMLMEQDYKRDSQRNQWPLRIQQIELDKIAQLINKPLAPFVVYVNSNENIGYKKNWQPIVMPPQKHRAYAFQWFSLAFAWLMLWVSGIFKQMSSVWHSFTWKNHSDKNKQ